MAEGETRKLWVGISACLLGERVRYDGGHKKNALVTETLGPHVEWVAICPEVELGLPIPRPAMDLVRGDDDRTRLVVTETGEDLTARMRAYATWRAQTLTSLDLDGYVLKSRSPSCGLGGAAAVGPGLFAEALAETMPDLPMEDEARLARPALREHFVERLWAAARWRDFVRRRPRAGDLQGFHAAHKYVLLAHSPVHHAKLTRLMTAAGRRREDAVVHDYGAGFAAALAVRATRARHAEVLAQLASFFERALAHPDRAALTAAIAGYRDGVAPLDGPRALIRDHVHRLGVAHLAEQVYLRPPAPDLIS